MSLSGEAVRSFIAVDIESRETLDEISAFQKMLLDTGADLKPVDVENIHVTLRFLGEIPSSLVSKIGEELKTLHFNPFEVSLQGVGVFPDMRRVNVVWVGIEKGVVELVDIHGQVEKVLKRLGIRPDDRGFSPHITIARVRSARNKDKLAEAVAAMRDREFGVFPVDSVKLKKSVLTPKGPVYSILAEARAAVK